MTEKTKAFIVFDCENTVRIWVWIYVCLSSLAVMACIDRGTEMSRSHVRAIGLSIVAVQ
jgi:hypothetical protein